VYVNGAPRVAELRSGHLTSKADPTFQEDSEGAEAIFVAVQVRPFGHSNDDVVSLLGCSRAFATCDELLDTTRNSQASGSTRCAGPQHRSDSTVGVLLARIDTRNGSGTSRSPR